jgi:hypothetical protein
VTTTRPGTWADAAKDMRIKAKDGSIWSLQARRRVEGTTQANVTMRLEISAAGTEPAEHTIREVVVGMPGVIQIVEDVPGAEEAAAELAARQAAHLADLTARTKAAVDAAPTVATKALAKAKGTAEAQGQPAPTGVVPPPPIPPPTPDEMTPTEAELTAEASPHPADLVKLSGGVPYVEPMPELTEALANIEAASDEDLATAIAIADPTGERLKAALTERAPAVDAPTGELWPFPPADGWTQAELACHLFFGHGQWTTEDTHPLAKLKGKKLAEATAAHHAAAHDPANGRALGHGIGHIHRTATAKGI